MSATISCIITSCNNRPWLKQAVESVLAQTRPVDEIVIADDASTDGSQDVIRALARDRRTITPVFREANIGVAANRDLAIREARGEVITTLDGDDVYYPQKIENEAGLLDQAADPIVIYSDHDLIDQTSQVRKRIEFSRLESLQGQPLVDYLARRAGPIPRDMLFAKSLYLEAGGFRHDLSLYEDWDLKLRLARTARAWWRAAAPGLGYRRHGQGLSRVDGLSHMEGQLKVIFANRHWLEPLIGNEAYGRALEGRFARAPAMDPVPAEPMAVDLASIPADVLKRAAEDAYERQDFEQAVLMMKALQDEKPCQNNTLLAHSLLLAVPWGELSDFLPRGTNSLLTSGWLNSVYRGAPVDGQGNPIPWYSYPAIEFVERLPDHDERVFEWGSGNSTLWWAQRAANVVSVEHDQGWYETIRSSMPDHVTLKHCSRVADYLDEIKAYPKGTFNRVVIDGEARNACAQLAADHVDEGGVIVFDNSDRRAFDEGLSFLAEKGWKRIDFYGLIPSYLYKNCTSVFFKDDAILKSVRPPSIESSCLGPTCSQLVGQ